MLPRRNIKIWEAYSGTLLAIGGTNVLLVADGTEMLLLMRAWNIPWNVSGWFWRRGRVGVSVSFRKALEKGFPDRLVMGAG